MSLDNVIRSWDYYSCPEVAGIARKNLLSALETWTIAHVERFVDDALLVVSELVANAINASPRRWIIGLHLTLEKEGFLIISVQDNCPRMPIWPSPALKSTDGHLEPDQMLESGRGLFLVETHSFSRGTIGGIGPKSVWACLVSPKPKRPPFATHPSKVRVSS